MTRTCTGYYGSPRPIFLCLEVRHLDEKLVLGSSDMFWFYIGRQWVYFFIREQTYITIHFSAGAIATSFEVGRTPQFVDFRNFKASPKFSSVVPYWWSSLVSRDHLACFFSHHGPHHNNLLSLVFVSSFSVSFNLAYWCFSSLGWVSMRLGIICQFHDAG